MQQNIVISLYVSLALFLRRQGLIDVDVSLHVIIISVISIDPILLNDRDGNHCLYGCQILLRPFINRLPLQRLYFYQL